MQIIISIMGKNIFKLQLKKFNGYIYTELQELETSVPVPVSKETNIETFIYLYYGSPTLIINAFFMNSRLLLNKLLHVTWSFFTLHFIFPNIPLCYFESIRITILQALSVLWICLLFITYLLVFMFPQHIFCMVG